MNRNPDRPVPKMWTNTECAKYYLCLDGEVFEFKCSVGLLFDVTRQICDFKQNVENCDITAGRKWAFVATTVHTLFHLGVFRSVSSLQRPEYRNRC